MKSSYCILIFVIVILNNLILYSQKEVYVIINQQTCFNCKTINLSNLLMTFKENNFKIIMAPQNVDKVEVNSVETVLKDNFVFDSLTFNFKQDLISNDNNLLLYVRHDDEIYIFNNIASLNAANSIISLTNSQNCIKIDESIYPIINITDDFVFANSNIYMFDSFQNSILVYDLKRNKIYKKYELKENPFSGNFTLEQISFLKSLGVYKPKILRLFKIDTEINLEIEIFNKYQINKITNAEGKTEDEKTYSSENFIYQIKQDTLIFVKRRCDIFDNSFFISKGYSPINDSIYVCELYKTDDYLNRESFKKRVGLININNCNIIDSISSSKITSTSMFGYSSKIYNFQDFILNFNYYQKHSSIHNINEDTLSSFNSDLFLICDSIISSVFIENSKVNFYNISYFNNKLFFSYIIENTTNQTKLQIVMIFDGNLKNTSFFVYKNVEDQLMSSILMADNNYLYLLNQYKTKRWILKKIDVIK